MLINPDSLCWKHNKVIVSAQLSGETEEWSGEAALLRVATGPEAANTREAALENQEQTLPKRGSQRKKRGGGGECLICASSL